LLSDKIIIQLKHRLRKVKTTQTKRPPRLKNIEKHQGEMFYLNGGGGIVHCAERLTCSTWQTKETHSLEERPELSKRNCHIQRRE